MMINHIWLDKKVVEILQCTHVAAKMDRSEGGEGGFSLDRETRFPSF